MTTLSTCAACRGLVPAGHTTCPHCAVSPPSARSRHSRHSKTSAAFGLLGAVGGSLVAVTLMACYGCPQPNCGGPFVPYDVPDMTHQDLSSGGDDLQPPDMAGADLQ